MIGHRAFRVIPVHEKDDALRLDEDLVVLVLDLEIEEIHFPLLGEKRLLVVEGPPFYPDAAFVDDGKPEQPVDDHGVGFHSRGDSRGHLGPLHSGEQGRAGKEG